MRRAFTLIELLVAMAMAVVVGMTALSLFSLIRLMTVSTTTSYLIARDVEEGLRQLRRDLRGTSLASIQVDYSLTPSLCMLSARDDTGKLVVGESGAPEWQGSVCYELQVPQGKQTGNLVRWRVPLQTDQPRLLPFPLPRGAQSVILRDVVAPNVAFPELDNLKVDDAGGFNLQFVRQTTADEPYTYSRRNPAEVTTQSPDGLNFTGNTRLVQLNLAVYEVPSTGKPTYLSIPVRVAPHYD